MFRTLPLVTQESASLINSIQFTDIYIVLLVVKNVICVDNQVNFDKRATRRDGHVKS